MIGGADIGRETADREQTAGVGEHAAEQRAVGVHPHAPAGERELGAVDEVVEIGVVPGAAVQDAAAGDAADIHRGAGRGVLGRRVPAHLRGVGDGIADRTGADGDTEAHRRAGTRRQGSVACCRQRRRQVRGADRDAGDQRRYAAVRLPDRQAVEGDRVRDVGRVGRHGIGERYIGGGHRADVSHDHGVLDLRADQRRTTAHHRDLLGDDELLGVADHDQGRLVTIARVAVGVGEQRRQLAARNRALVADDGAGRHAAVDLHVEGQRGRAAGRQGAGAGARQRRRQVRGADRHAGNERRDAAVRLSDRQAVQLHRVGHIGGVGRHRIGEHHPGGRNRPGVGDGDGVAQHVARVHLSCRAAIRLDLHGLEGVHQRQVADHVAGRVIGHRRGRVIRRLLRHRPAGAGAVHEALIRNHRAIQDTGIDHHVEGDGRDIAGGRGGVGTHDPRGGIFRGVNQETVLQRRRAGHRIGDRRSVQGGTAGDIGGVGRDLVAQAHAGGILGADVLDGNGVAQGFTGVQHRRIASDIVGDLEHAECRRRGDAHRGRILVTEDGRVLGAVQDRVVAVRQQHTGHGHLRLVRHHRAVDNDRRQTRFEHDRHGIGATGGRDTQVAHIHQAGAPGAAGGAGIAAVGTNRHRGQRQTAGHEHGRGIQPVQLVGQHEIVQRRGADVLHAEGVAQHVARGRGQQRGRGRLRLAGGHIEHGLLEAQQRPGADDGGGHRPNAVVVRRGDDWTAGAGTLVRIGIVERGPVGQHAVFDQAAWIDDHLDAGAIGQDQSLTGWNVEAAVAVAPAPHQRAGRRAGRGRDKPGDRHAVDGGGRREAGIQHHPGRQRIDHIHVERRRGAGVGGGDAVFDDVAGHRRIRRCLAKRDIGQGLGQRQPRLDHGHDRRRGIDGLRGAGLAVGVAHGDGVLQRVAGVGHQIVVHARVVADANRRADGAGRAVVLRGRDHSADIPQRAAAGVVGRERHERGLGRRLAVDGRDADEAVSDVVTGVVRQHVADATGRQIVTDGDVVADALRQTDFDLEVLVRADGRNRGRREIGLGGGQRRHRGGSGRRGFMVVDRMAGIRQRAVAQAGVAAVGADQAGAVERGALAGQRVPARLDGVVENFLRLHPGADPHLESETDARARRDGVIRIRRVPLEDRPVRAQGGVDHIRRIEAADIAEIGEVGDRRQIVEHPQVVGAGGAGIGGGDGYCQHVTGIGIDDRERLGQGYGRLAHHDREFTEGQGHRVTALVDVTRGDTGRGPAVADHAAVVVGGAVLDPGDEADREVVVVTGRPLGHALVAEVPLHQAAGAGRRDNAAWNKTGGRIRRGIEIDGRRLAAADAGRQLVADHEVAQQRHRQARDQLIFHFLADRHRLRGGAGNHGARQARDRLRLGQHRDDFHRRGGGRRVVDARAALVAVGFLRRALVAEGAFETVIGRRHAVGELLARGGVVVEVDAVIEIHRLAGVDAQQRIAVGMGKAERRGRGVLDGVVADRALAVGVGGVDQAVAVVVEAVARERQHVGQIAGVEDVGGRDVVGRCARHAARRRLIGERDAIDVRIARIAIVGQRHEVAARHAHAIQRLVAHRLADQDPRLGDGQADAAHRLARIANGVGPEVVDLFRRRRKVRVHEHRLEIRVQDVGAQSRMLVGRGHAVDRVVQQTRGHVDPEPFVLCKDAGVGRVVVECPIDPALIQRCQCCGIQADAGNLGRARESRIGGREITLAVRQLVDHLDVLHRDIGKARGLEPEPAAGVDVEAALLADLRQHVRQGGQGCVVLRAVTELALEQVEADDAGADAVQRIVVGAIGDAVGARQRRREP